MFRHGIDGVNDKARPGVAKNERNLSWWMSAPQSSRDVPVGCSMRFSIPVHGFQTREINRLQQQLKCIQYSVNCDVIKS